MPVVSAPGGFVENSLTASARPLLSDAAIQAFLPQRGAFTFPAPYNTRAARITTGADCGDTGLDCVYPVGYSYWRNSNNHVNDDTMLIFASLRASRGGTGVTLFSYNKVTEEVKNLGPLFPQGSTLAAATGEQWYFSGTLPNALYVKDGAKLARFDVISKTTEVVFDAAAEYGAGHIIWQPHSSYDDRVHSASLRNSSFQDLGCIVHFEDTGETRFFPSEGGFDECQIDKSGRFVVLRANNDNTIVDLDTGKKRVITDEQGAGGHSDMGFGTYLAADNWASQANAWKVWDFRDATLQGSVVYHNTTWSPMAPSHVSFSNAREDMEMSEQYGCGSSASASTALHANEVICFMLAPGSRDTLVVAPVMTDQNASGGGDNYSRMPKGNLDITGQYFIWTSNMGGDRMDLFLVKIPAQKLLDK